MTVGDRYGRISEAEVLVSGLPPGVPLVELSSVTPTYINADDRVVLEASISA
jgi:hypothetical protein